MRDAAVHGVPGHARARWVRRKYGSTVVVTRTRADDSPGCSVPCVCCAKAIGVAGLKVACFLPGTGGWWSGSLGEEGAPRSRTTSRQKRMWGF